MATTTSAGGAAAMTGAQFRATRERLGVDVPWLAAHLGLSTQAMARYDHGWRVDRKVTVSVPAHVATKLHALVEATDRYVTELVADCRRRSAGGGIATITVYHNDDEYAAAAAAGHVPSGMQARWHRAAAFRAADQLPGSVLTYPEAGANGLFSWVADSDKLASAV